MGCCNAKAKKPNKGGNAPQQLPRDKYGRPRHRNRGSPFTQDRMVYTQTKEMAQLACKDPASFISMTKKAEVKDLSKYVGFDLVSERDVILQSSRTVLSTVDWNPLTFALLLHDQSDLRDYILHECNFNVPQLLAIGLPEVTVTNVRDWTEDELVEGQIKTLTLLAEHRTDNFDLILNKFHHFLSDKLLYKLIPKVAQTMRGPEAILSMMQSHALKGLFYEKVTQAGFYRVKGSFLAFFNEYLAGAAQASKACGEAMFKCLQEEPYSLAFGLQLLTTPDHYLVRQFSKGANRVAIQAAFKNCCSFSDFQVFHLFKQTGLGDTDLETLNETLVKNSASGHHSDKKEATEFVQMIKKRDVQVKNNFSAQVEKLQAAVAKGKESTVQKCLKSVPAEALFTIPGPQLENQTVNPFPTQTDAIKLDTTRMTIFELACCLKHHKLLDMLISGLGVRHERDFTRDRASKQIHEQIFVFVPILNRDETTLQKLLELTNLWTLRDLHDIMLFCKQLKWFEGIEVVLKSKSCHRQYLTIPHTEQNAFLQQVSDLPFQLMDDIEANDSTVESNSLQVTRNGKKVTDHQVMNPQENQGDRASISEAPASNGQRSKMEHDEHERYELRRVIALALSCRPYASHYMIMDFLPKFENEHLRQLKHMEKQQQLLYDRIDSAIACNESASDWELHDFICASKGQISDLLRSGIEEKSKNISDLGKEEFNKYKEEMVFFIDRLEAHSTMVAIKAEQQQVQ